MRLEECTAHADSAVIVVDRRREIQYCLRQYWQRTNTKLFFVQLKQTRFPFLQYFVERVCKDCEVLDESAINVADSEERAEIRSRLRWFRVF